MGFDLYVEAIESLDDKEIEEARKKHAAYLACEAAGVEVPDSLDRYFTDLDVYPSPEVPFEDFVKSCGKTHLIYSLRGSSRVLKGSGEYEKGSEHRSYLIDLSKLPKRTKRLRVNPSP